MTMRTGLWLMLAVAAASALAVSLDVAFAHNWVPRYDGQKWGLQCKIPMPRTTPPTCCQRTQYTCRSACGLADVDEGWKNACRANCDAAGQACLREVAPVKPPVGDRSEERWPGRN
jgi:hypothetical protein